MVEQERTPDTGQKRNGRRGRTMWIVGTVAGLVGVVAGGVAGYGIATTGGSASGGCLASERSATGTTGQSEGPKDGGRDALEVVDSGFRPFTAAKGDADTEYASFGFVVENSTKYVILDAYVQVFILNADEDVTGYEPKLGPLDQDTRGRLENVHIPEIQPGQRIGMGTSVLMSTAEGVDPATDETFDRGQIDYDKLEVAVELESAQWWYPKGDTYAFGEIKVTDIRAKQLEKTGNEYSDGSEGVELGLEYDVDSPFCRPTAAYSPSSVAYDADGNIVGGTMSGWLHTKDQESRFGSERTYVDPPKPDQTYPAGKGSSDNESLDSAYNFQAVKAELPNLDGMKFEIHPFAPPVTPNLD